MTPLTAFFAKFIGAYALFAGAWLYWRREAAMGLLDRISKDPVFESVIGVLRVTFGLVVISAHNRWSGWLEALVSTVGWIGLFSGLAALFLPAGFLGRVIEWMRLRENLPTYSAVSAGIGALLLLGGLNA